MRMRGALALLACLTFAGPAKAECHLTVGFEDWAPYTAKTADGQVVGIDADFARAILARVGCTAIFVERPWARSLAELKTGGIDILTSAGRTAEREDYASFAGPYRKEIMAVVVRVGSREESLDALIATKGKIGVVRGYFYSDLVSALIAAPGTRDRFKISTSDDENLRALATGKLQGIIADFMVTEDLARRNGVDTQIRSTRSPVAVNDIYLMLSKTSVPPDLASRIAQAALEMANDGSGKAILKSFIKE